MSEFDLSSYLWPDVRLCRQPQGSVTVDWSNPITRGIVDAWLPKFMATMSVCGRKPTVTGPISLNAGLFGLAASALSTSIRYDVGSIFQSGTWCVVAICEFKSYGAVASLIRRDQAAIPVQIAGSSVRSVGWSEAAGINKYYTNPTGTKAAVLISNRVSQSTEKLYVDGSNVLTYSSFTGYGSTANPLCFLGTESNGELFTSSIGSFYGAIVFDRALSDAEIASISANPWQIFAPKSIPFLNAASGTNEYIISPVGDITLSGTYPIRKGHVYISTGNITLNGTAPISVGSSSSSYVLSASGSVILSGSYSIIKNRIMNSSGTITLSGTKSIIRNRTISPSGSFTLNGTSTVIKIKNIVPQGTISFTGNATIYTPGTLTVNTRLPLTGVGK